MKITILLNPSSGRGKARCYLRPALEILQRGHAVVDVHESRNAQHLVELAHQACAEKPDLIVSAGGDGTHHYVINGLVGTDIPLGLLPMGSGNDFAKGIGVPVVLEAAASTLLKARVREIDLAKAGGIFYGGIAGVGFDSVVTRYANEQVRWPRGTLAYAWSILRCLKDYRPEPLEVRTDTQSYSGEVLLAVVGNNVSYGGGVKLTPHARLDDGLLDVCIVPYLKKLELLCWVPRAYRGQHLSHPRVVYFQARRIEMNGPSRLELFGDGEFMQQLPATIEVMPRALRIVGPE